MTAGWRVVPRWGVGRGADGGPEMGPAGVTVGGCSGGRGVRCGGAEKGSRRTVARVGPVLLRGQRGGERGPFVSPVGWEGPVRVDGGGGVPVGVGSGLVW